MLKIPKKIALLILAVGLVIYARSLFNGFVWDDEEQIVLNSEVHSLSNFFSLWSGSTFNSGGAVRAGGLYYKPMMTSIFTLFYVVFGPSPFFFHLGQILLHGLNAVLVFLVLKALFKREKLALLLALIFLVHPVNSEAVVYVSAYQDVLFFFFGIAAFWLLLTQNSAKTSYWVSLLLTLSIFSKETGIVWIFACGLYLILFKLKEKRKYFLGMVGSIGIYAFFRFGVARIFFAKHGLTVISRISLWERLKSVPAIIWFYLKTYLWPLNLAIDQQWVIEKTNFQNFWLPLILSLLFLGVILGLGIYLWRRKSQFFSLYLFFALCFVVSFGFHLQIFPLDMTVAERWFYLPGFCLLGMVGAAVVEFNHRNHVFLPTLMVLGLCLLGARTFVRTFDWQDGLTLYAHDLPISKDSFDLENNYGVALFRAGRFDEARPYFEKSITLAPYWWTNYNNLGAYWERKGDLAQAEKLYYQAVVNGNYYLAYENYAQVLIKEGKDEVARAFLEKSLGYFPQNSRLQTLLKLILPSK